MHIVDKNRTAYYAALSIFFGTIELFIPKLIPFFRLGLSNIPILLVLDLPFSSYILLLSLKALGNSYIQGNLFSFYSLISISQAYTSGLLMWLCNKLGKNTFSVYSLSAIGAFCSTITQLFVASLYIGKSVYFFSSLMLIVSLFSSIIVAFIATKINLPKDAPFLKKGKEEENENKNWLYVTFLILSSISIMITTRIILIIFNFILALLLQKTSGRKIMVLPYFFIILFMILTSLFTPEGEIIFSLGIIRFTAISLLNALKKGFILSTTVALSQAYSSSLRGEKTILGKTLAYFSALLVAFRTTKGKKIITRVKDTLSLETLSSNQKQQKRTSIFIFFIFTLLFLFSFITSFVIKFTQ